VLDVTEACPALILSKWGTRWTFPDFVRSPAYDVVDPPPSWPSTVTKQMEQVYDKTIVNFPWVNISPWQESRDQGLLVSKWGSGARLTNLRYEISGVTRDQNGQPLGYCTVQLIARDTLIVAQETESDGNGNYAFYVPDPDQEYFVRAFKAGAPDRWGTTEHTLKGEAT
ncbi:MAG: carboxypeptidase-like regulatory domain-containing protein, partial [Candidatus Bathyarchaeia archaeon]